MRIPISFFSFNNYPHNEGLGLWAQGLGISDTHLAEEMNMDLVYDIIISSKTTF